MRSELGDSYKKRTMYASVYSSVECSAFCRPAVLVQSVGRLNQAETYGNALYMTGFGIHVEMNRVAISWNRILYIVLENNGLLSSLELIKKTKTIISPSILAAQETIIVGICWHLPSRIRVITRNQENVPWFRRQLVQSE